MRRQIVPVFEPLVMPNPTARTIYLCGDLTVTDQRNEPWAAGARSFRRS